MKPIRRWLKSFLLLSSSQANGLMVLLPLLFLFIISEPVWRWRQIRHWQPDPRDAFMLDSLVAVWQTQLHSPGSGSSSAFLRNRPDDNKSPAYFPFDPNTATTEELILLGFDERLAQRIDNYRRKGGVFKTRQDMLKIYGMDTAHFERLIRYVVIARKPDDNRPSQLKGVPGTRATTPFSGDGTWKKREADQPFDINLADTARLEAVRGIGEKLSRRIIKYRSSLGGFVRIGQLGEVFGLDSVAMQELMQFAFVAPDFLPDRIDVNTASEKMLEAHPYLSRQEARMIVAYRFQHGRFAAVSDLRKLPTFSDEKVRQLEPYLKSIE